MAGRGVPEVMAVAISVMTVIVATPIPVTGVHRRDGSQSKQRKHNGNELTTLHGLLLVKVGRYDPNSSEACLNLT
jgi:hypothetical protein